MEENSTTTTLEAIFEAKTAGYKEPDLDDGDDDFELINEEEFGGKKLTPQVEKQLISLLEHALIDKSVENDDGLNEVEEGDEDDIDGEIPESELPAVIHKIGHDFGDWLELRKKTIHSLRDIADYIDSITHKSAMVKAVGSGSGIIAGTLTLAGGILTILSAGAALPVLIAGTGLGLAAGVAGGTAAVTEKVLKSRQMSVAKLALEADHAATLTLETHVALLRRNKRLVSQVARHAIVSGGSAVSDSLKIAQLVAGKSGASSTIEAGIRAMAKLLGDDVGKEVSKILLHTSGRVLSGAVTVVFGGATVIYDIYRLNSEVQTLAGKGKDGATDIRSIADQLESSLDEFLTGDVKEDLDEEVVKVCDENLAEIDKILQRP